ncbi:hypothetical protein Sjap_014556 [Stephania japonica]|uniref:Uncharacterized protein n=1 Tax=Stephania japonica TaxID=461633 RepID=A0AAP0IHG5_9MAGN
MKLASASDLSYFRAKTTPRDPQHFHPNKLVFSVSPIRSELEIRVCVNRTCAKQGSRETLEILSGIAPSNVSINSCGCLGRCGAGPNLVVLPDELLVSHCGTAAQAAEVMARIGCGEGSKRSLEALALRKRAEGELERGNWSEAEVLLSQAIDLKPSGGLHFILRSRSVGRLAMGNYLGALEDAEEAIQLAPKYPQAYLCQGDAFLALEKFDAAENSYAIALEIDPSLRRSKSFKARVAKLQEKLSAANAPS